jgi:hypothetical protein
MRLVSPAAVRTSTARTRRPPRARVAAAPERREARAILAAVATSGPGVMRGSTMATTAAPALARSRAVRRSRWRPCPAGSDDRGS